MKEKGFTLIELLAVIVILAIIALIATPIILGIINDTKREAVERSAENYLKALNISLVAQNMNGTLEDGIYSINSDGSIQLGDKKIKIDISMEEEITGFVTLTNGKARYSSLNIGEKTLIYDENGKKEIGVWDGKIDVIEESEDEYHIKNERQLAWVSKQVESGNTFEGKTLYLDADLDLNNIEWNPIGNTTYHFKGIFEGQNHLIINIKVSKSQEDANNNKYLGLFGYAYGATIKDLTLINVNITGHSRIGALSGISRSSIVSNINVLNTNISCINRCGAVSGIINGDNIEGKYIKDINAYYSTIQGNDLIGGVIGYLKTTTSAYNINSNQLYVEGLYKVGGVIGSSENSKISTSYSNSTVNSENSTEKLSGVGGVIGFSYNSSLDNIISNTIVKGNSNIGGIIGQFQTNSKLTNSISYAKVYGTNMVGGVIGTNNAFEAENIIENIKSETIVSGIDEVGGVIGRSGQGITISKNIYSKSNITGTSKIADMVGGFSEYATEMQYSNLVSESILNTEYIPYNNLFGHIESNTTLIEIN